MSAKDWVGGLKNDSFCCTFSMQIADIVFYLGVSEKVQKCADVIYGWSHTYLSPKRRRSILRNMATKCQIYEDLCLCNAPRIASKLH